MGTTRFVYNKALEHVRTLEQTRVNVPQLTTKFITHKYRNGETNSDIPQWSLETPKDIRKGALRDLEKAFKTAFSNLKVGNIQQFKVGFKHKKSFPSVEVPKTALKFKDGKLQMYPTYGLGDIQISKRQKKKDLVDITMDCRLQYKNGDWYLVVPCKSTSKPVVPSKSVCALDPGVRTFQTLYSPTEIIKFQQNRELTKKLQTRLDYFQSLRAKKEIRSYSYHRRQKRIYRKLGWMTDQLHYSTIQELKSYKHILLPTFDSQEMVRQKRLYGKTKRELLGLQHYTFKQRLQNSLKLQEFSNVTIVSEAYTSKTCTRCGSLNTPSLETYECSNCNLKIDRDINGARNILLKHLINI